MSFMDFVQNCVIIDCSNWVFLALLEYYKRGHVFGGNMREKILGSVYLVRNMCIRGYLSSIILCLPLMIYPMRNGSAEFF